jgi:phosphatidylglycerol:prolipoprotein diacylglycerol transferase
LLGFAGFIFLVKLWKPSYPDGRLFMIYLMTASIFRFSIEFLRLQPKVLLGLSEAQLFSIGLFVLGTIGVLRSRPGEPTAQKKV